MILPSDNAENTRKPEEFEKEIFKTSAVEFAERAIHLFNFQFHNNPLYRTYCKTLQTDPKTVKEIKDIPFLPIGFFKTNDIKTTDFEPEMVFESSGTSGMQPSKHLIKKLSVYQDSFRHCFELIYGAPSEYCFLALLPSYQERKGSSLIYMAEDLIRLSKRENSGFFLNEDEKLRDVLVQNEARGIKTILLGVTYALLDFAEKYPMPLKHTIIMETGGMKGRKKEMLREEVHQILKARFEIGTIHSEYGMTELLSQAYSSSDGLFNCPPWMKICIRSEDDPRDVKAEAPLEKTEQGAVNIIDLANIYSCAFIATDDYGVLNDDGSFEIRGRMDNSDLRGCSLMIEG